MRIRILASARRDLDEGYAFYESQEEGLGWVITSFLPSAPTSKGFVFPEACIESRTGIIIACFAGYFRSLCFI